MLINQKIISKGFSSSKKQILFGKIEFWPGTIINDEEKNKQITKYFKNYSGSKDFSPNLRSFLKEIHNIDKSSQEYDDSYGEEWTFEISIKQPFEIKEEEKKIIINHDKYEEYLRKGLTPSIKKVQYYFKNYHTKSGIKMTSRNSIVENLNHEIIKKEISLSDTKYKKIFLADIINQSKDKEQIIEQIKNTIFNSKYKEFQNLIKTEPSESKLQKYLEENKELFFFGYKFIGTEKYVKDIVGDIFDTKSRFDILLSDEYGIPKIIELKKSKEYLLNWDSSHNKFVPTSKLSNAISQLQSYLRIISRNEENSSQKLGIKKGFEPLAQGILIMGHSKHLFKQNKINIIKKTKEWSDAQINDKAFLELNTINYNQKNLTIITYDKFIEGIKEKTG